ncbi:MAG TPA: MFS transporter [Pseudorhodoplanes sp.]|nr:MFS transporter [Pseudorhodoplanes sp.]
MTAAADTGGADRRDERRVLAVSAGAHALHDGYTDLIYVMLPVWQAEFGLSYAAIGVLRGLFAGTMAALQVPSGILAERVGAAAVLAAGTALAGIGYLLAGMSAGFVMLTLALAIGGAGASTQHPIASALVARAFAGSRSLKALGSYNFAGDIGKMVFPAATAFMMTLTAWRTTLAAAGALGLATAAAILLLTPRNLPSTATPANEAPIRGSGSRKSFLILLSIGILDSATRMGFLTFLPFLLQQKGASLPLIGTALTLVFAGGAAGKLVCAFIGARLGIVATVCLTEAITVALILLLITAPLDIAMIMLPVLGIFLNGTSSVLYGSVPDLVPAHKRDRAFGIFYTGTIGAGAAAPFFYGMAGDALGIVRAIILVACLLSLTLPLALMLRPAFAR